MSLYDGPYQRRRRLLIAQANSNLTSKCWQCKQPLATCGPNRTGKHKNGSPAKWTAGHVIDGDRTSPLALECSPCNYTRGAADGNRRRGGRGVAILTPQRTPEDPAMLRLSDSAAKARGESGSGSSRSPKQAAGGSKKRVRGSTAATNSKIVEQATPQGRACTECPKTYKSERGLAAHVAKVHPPPGPSGPPPDESVSVALERLLADVEMTPRRLLLVAQLRRVVGALAAATPGAVEKLSKELTALRSELLREVTPRGDDDDWTKGSGTPEVRDTPKP
jgi:hypothetical protein